MSAELLKFPSLSLQYFKTITLVCELYPDKICNLNPELQKNLIASLELGKILFLYELLYEIAIDKFPYLLEKFVKSSVVLVKRHQISTWAMWKSDFHMTYVENIFKLLLFDKNFD